MVDHDTGESPLHSWHAEQALAGALLLDHHGDAFEKAQPLMPEDLAFGPTRTVYEAIAPLARRGVPHGADAVLAALRATATDDVDIDVMAASLDEFIRYAEVWRANPSKTAKLIREAAQRRRIHAAAEALLTAAEDGQQSLDALLEQAGAALSTIARGGMRKEPRRLADVAHARTAYYEALQSGSVPVGIRLASLPWLTQQLGVGLKGKKLYLIGARPGTGKTAFALQIAAEAGRQGIPTIVLSQEMSAEEIADRGVSNLGRVDYGRLQTGDLSADDWSSVAAMLDDLAGMPVWVDDQGALTLDDIRAKVRMVPGVRLVIVDYLQLCSGRGGKGGRGGDNRNTEIEEISRGLKALAMELDIAVIALSQLNRSVETRPDKRPVMSDLRDSGAIEQDADAVLFLWPVRDLECGDRLVGLCAAKNRFGRPGAEIGLQFRGRHQRWAETTEPLNAPGQTTSPQPRGFKS